ncbi:CHAT domain-containing protein [Rhizobium leguminosarum bv. viciae]|nr:CHAT domain-containing protein [Rhizobium leguminosarum bv. viciae]
MKTVRAPKDIEAKIDLARAAFALNRLGDAAAILEKAGKTDEGFVASCDRLLQIYREQLELDHPDKEGAERIRLAIDKLLQRRADLEKTFKFPSAYLSGPDANFAKDIFFVARSKRRQPNLHGPFAAARTSGPGSVQFGSEKELTFVPHIDTAAIAENEIAVTVFLNSEPFRKGESGFYLQAAAGATITAHLAVSHHFEVVGDTSRTFVVQKQSTSIKFKDFYICRKEDASSWPGQPHIGAFFVVGLTPCGSVTLSVDLDGNVIETRPARPFRLQSGEKPVADLLISISAAPGDRDFMCWVSSAHLDEHASVKGCPWVLNGKAEEIVSQYMERFVDPDTQASQLVAELRGVGRRLFKEAPDVFKQAMWALFAAGKSIETIAILTEEPFVPWELMIPTTGPNGDDFDFPLGAQYSVGRWIEEVAMPPSALGIMDSIVIAPEYEDGDVLAQSQAEATAVNAAFAGDIVRPADFDAVVAALTAPRGLLHFVCHGEDKGTGGQALLLDGKGRLTESNLDGIKGARAAIAAKGPMVFLNACKVGRGNPSLRGSRNFASQFIEMGAKAVIAPLWDVNDAVAHEVALTFYNAIKAAPEKPFASILKDIRRKAYESGVDTYAAYCFFGNPLAVAAS